MNALELAILSYLLNSLWQVPLLFATGWLAARMLRSAGPAAQHCVWVGAVLLQTLLPACSLVSMEWLRSVLLWSSREGAATAGGVSAVTGPGVAAGVSHLPASLLFAVEIFYGSSIAYFLLRFLWRARVLAALRREAIKFVLTDDAAEYWERCSTTFGVRGATLAASSAVFGPVMMGVRRKLVLLPAAMVDTLEQADLETVIAHEFAHMHRQDFLKNLAYELISLPVRYHPIFWLTREALIESREMVCDQMAAKSPGDESMRILYCGWRP